MELLRIFQVVHISGKNQLDYSIREVGYKQFEFVGSELADLYAASDLVVSRSGSNTIFELLMLRKPMLLIPLPLDSSRGDQILNAEVFRKNGYAEVISNDQLKDSRHFLDTIKKVYSQGEVFQGNMKSSGEPANVKVIFEAIKDL
jgi:UDP-N-acetylglucosamine--N-acetylmuramyl-(pentapeptide) pyrophosphoryl-undecaprenol N-acetylglucosamine transferase